MLLVKFCRSKHLTYGRLTKLLSQRYTTKADLSADSLRQKIIYNCLLIQDDFRSLTYSERRRRKLQLMQDNFDSGGDARPAGDDAFCLKYLSDPEPPKDEKPVVRNEILQFPFDKTGRTVISSQETEERKDEVDMEDMEWTTSTKTLVRKLVKDKNWIPHNPDVINDAITVDGKSYNLQYGSVDPDEPVSNVSCGGCGALLHCQDTSIPGFLPKEIFHGLNDSELKTLVCQRCHFLKEYDIALGVDVSPDDYPRILEPIRNQKALVLLMVDLLDVPCSIWPGLLDIIGHKRPVVVVGNKVDLLVHDSPDLQKNIKDSLIDCLLDAGMPKVNIKHIALISAKSGYGVENLITKLHESWRYQGDVYIVGCTNVGKSTLFNTLIQSDFCKVQAVDLMQRATVSEWPGTTLNLLKFPILRPSHWRLFVRRTRMIHSEKKEMQDLALRVEQLKKSRYTKQSSLVGDVGRTFMPESPMESSSDPFSVAISTNPRGVSPLGLNPESQAFKESRWCYDTPGVVHPDQILNLLTTPEIMATVPKSLIIPRPVHLKPGHSILIAGLARLDLLDGPNFVWLTIFAAETLPLTVTKTEDIEEVYSELLGTDLLKVPSGGSERLAKWPSLAGKTVNVSGKYMDEVAAEVVLSSAGWVAVTVLPAEQCTLRAWTPGGRGIHVRMPFMRKAHKLRGPRIKGTPVFKPIRPVNEQ